jgi:hypothetical protein
MRKLLVLGLLAAALQFGGLGGSAEAMGVQFDGGYGCRPYSYSYRPYHQTHEQLLACGLGPIAHSRQVRNAVQGWYANCARSNQRSEAASDRTSGLLRN